jgi:maltose O-acetyltransferase
MSLFFQRYLKIIKKDLRETFMHALLALPDALFSYRLRQFFFRYYFCSLGKNVLFAAYSRFNKPMNVVIGDNVAVSRGVLVTCSGQTQVKIGNDVLIGPYVVIRTDDHVFDRIDIPIRLQGHKGADVIIEDDCWIGAHAIILKGVHVGKGSVIGAGSIVTNDIPPYSIAVGAPAKVIRKRGADA